MVRLVCGCGYLGMRVARRWIAAGEAVWATTRSPRRATEFASCGLKPIVLDVTEKCSLPAELTSIDTVLFALGFDRTPHQTIDAVHVGGLRNLLAALPRRVGKFIYVSSTGVYGQSHGEWVDENSPCLPTRAGGLACLAAERILATSSLGEQGIVLRLAGIYGPGRIPKIDAIQHGMPIPSPETGFLNLIHVADAVDVVLGVESLGAPPRTINVSDGHPVPRGEFYRELARILRAPDPQFLRGQAELPADRTAGDKRVDSRRLREILPAPLRFPTYREGLAAIVAGTAG